jgi:hypothetical protein
LLAIGVWKFIRVRRTSHIVTVTWYIRSVRFTTVDNLTVVFWTGLTLAFWQGTMAGRALKQSTLAIR